MAVSGNQQLIPFRRGTRQHFDMVGDIPYVSNRAGTPRRMNQVGFLNKILIHVVGTMNLAAAGALTADGPWSLIRRIRVTLNTGVAIVTLSGFGAFLVNHLLKEEFNPAVGTARTFSVPVAMGDNAWTFMLEIPIAANDGQNFEVGLINLQTEELVCNTEIDWGPETDAVTNVGTGFVGRADVFALWYEVPDPTKVRYPPLNILHRLEEVRTIVIGTGDNRIPLLRQGTLLQLIHTLTLNGARNTVDLVALRLELNRSDRVYRYGLAPLEWFASQFYGQNLPVGVFAWDWWYAQKDVSQGDGRDFVDTEAVAQIDSVLEINAAAVLGANNNFIDTIRRFTQVLIP